MSIDHKLIDNLLKDHETSEDMIGEGGLAQKPRWSEHPDYEPLDTAGDYSPNGTSRKMLHGQTPYKYICKCW